MVVLSLFNLQGNAQTKLKKGVITFEITKITGQDMDQQANVGMFDRSGITMTFAKNRISTEIKFMTTERTMIEDLKAGQTYMLMEIARKKVAIHMSNRELMSQRKSIDYNVTYTDVTKMIAGYECKKAILKFFDGREEIVYYTDEFYISKDRNKLKYDLIDGFVMEYPEKIYMDMEAIMTVTSITSKVPNKKVLRVPKDYPIMTMDEFKTMMMDGGGRMLE